MRYDDDDWVLDLCILSGRCHNFGETYCVHKDDSFLGCSAVYSLNFTEVSEVHTASIIGVINHNETT
jgi:hypothetical protein